MTQRSYCFGEDNEDINDTDNIFISKYTSITLSDISNQLANYHNKIIQRMDRDSKFEQVQKNLTKLIIQRFDHLTQAIQEIRFKIGVETAANTRESNHSSQSPQRQKIIESNLLSQEINRDTQIFNIQQYFQYREEEQQNYSQMKMLDTNQQYKIVSQEENIIKNDVFQPSHLLNHFKTKFAQMSLKFDKCDLLYQFPQMKHIDFHHKIDHKKNIFFLAQLENNQIIGAFSNVCFDPAPNYIPKQNSKSFICNINRSIYAYAYRINKTHTHDPNYLIFGNWEIKVKNGEDVLETNWGTNGDCFSLKSFGQKEIHKMKNKELFGQGAQNKRLKIRKYHFYAFS